MDTPTITLAEEIQLRSSLRAIIKGGYDLQQLRIQMGNRIAANFRVKMGQAPGEKTETMPEDNIKVIDEIKTSYKRLADGLADDKSIKPKDFVGNEIISNFAEYALVKMYIDMERDERAGFKRAEVVIQQFPIWNAFLKDVRGCGVMMAGVILSEYRIDENETVGAMWKRAGLDVAEDGRGRSRRKEHQVRREYIDRNGKPATKMSITFNPFLKTKLVGVLADVMIKLGSDYKTEYDNYKRRLENHEKYGIAAEEAAKKFKEAAATANSEIERLEREKTEVETEIALANSMKDYAGIEEKQAKSRNIDREIANIRRKKSELPFVPTKAHRHRMAVRYMIKRFLVDLYLKWRAIHKLPITQEYAVAKLGMVHHSSKSQFKNAERPTES